METINLSQVKRIRLIRSAQSKRYWWMGPVPEVKWLFRVIHKERPEGWYDRHTGNFSAEFPVLGDDHIKKEGVPYKNSIWEKPKIEIKFIDNDRRTLYFNSDEEAESYMEDKIKAIAEKYQIPYIEIETE
jgi:hypothetical protein